MLWWAQKNEYKILIFTNNDSAKTGKKVLKHIHCSNERRVPIRMNLLQNADKLMILKVEFERFVGNIGQTVKKSIP